MQDTKEEVRVNNLLYDINIQAKLIKDMTMMLGAIEAECFEDFEMTVKEILAIMEVMVKRIIELTEAGMK